MLGNREGLRIGIIVNDVAEVNVDAKLVRGDPNAQGGSADFIELQNGCICCTMGEELFVSVDKLVGMSKAKGKHYDHIVIESSGVSEPKAVRSMFQDAEAYRMPLMNEVRLDTMVTVVDTGAFLEAYTTGDRMLQRPDLGMGEDDPTFQQALAGGSAQRAVVDLLVEQVECADMLVLNKMDTLEDGKEGLLMDILRALNPHASMVTCEYGNVPLQEVLGVMEGQGIAESGSIDDHKDSLMALESGQGTSACSTHVDTSTHTHTHAEGNTNPDCTAFQEETKTSEVGHGHSHGHSHRHEGEAVGAVADFDPDCAACSEEGGDHDHSHSHDHGSGEGTTTAASRFGIDNFVYRQRRPFHPERLAAVLEYMPGSSNLALTEVTGWKGRKGKDWKEGENATLGSALAKLVRSKGFMWLAYSDEAAMYWSQAGANFEVLCLGRWWASLGRELWPPGAEEAITIDFEGDYGDRRQELVFIGLGVSEGTTREIISSALDSCLLTDDEFELYNQTRQSTEILSATFPSKLRVRFTS
ncbi:unnamed protein product [Choristocarpus tenellus]